MLESVCSKTTLRSKTLKFCEHLFLERKENKKALFLKEGFCYNFKKRNYLYITFFTALITSSLFGSHSANSVGEYGAGVSAVFILITGASK